VYSLRVLLDQLSIGEYCSMSFSLQAVMRPLVRRVNGADELFSSTGGMPINTLAQLCWCRHTDGWQTPE
jgi:hypothetical protein